jgi:hypothetical protein
VKKSKLITIILIVFIVGAVVCGSVVAGVYNAFLKPQSFYDYIIPVSGEGTGYYRHCYEDLNEEEKKLYSVILAEVYTQPEKIEVPELVNSELKKVFNALLYDNPDLFNVGLKCKMYTSGYKSFFEIEYVMDYDTYKERMAEVEAIAAVIVADADKFTSDYEKEKYVHDYIVNHCSYAVPAEGNNSNNIYGCLVEGKAGCEGYSRAFQYLLNKLNIDNRLISGEATEDGVNYIPHMWNYVTISGKNYFVDVTWDDPVSTCDVLFHNYFNVNTEEILRNHRNLQQVVPLTIATEHNYHVMEGSDISIGSGAEFEALVYNAVNNAKYNNQTAVELRFPNEAVVEQALNSLFNSGVIYNAFNEADIPVEAGTTQIAYMRNESMHTVQVLF